MSKLGRLLGVFAVVAGFAGIANAAPVYVGSWHVGDGPVWTSNPAVYTGQEAAALLFGGVASDYAISTVSSNPGDINFMAFVDGWGDSTYLYSPAAQNFGYTTGTGYNDPYGGPSFSAYVLDHSCFNRYSDPSQVCSVDDTFINYAFRVDGPNGAQVPEPAALALFGLGLAGLGVIRRRR